jgi:hypothetical protein
MSKRTPRHRIGWQVALLGLWLGLAALPPAFAVGTGKVTYPSRM